MAVGACHAIRRPPQVSVPDVQGVIEKQGESAGVQDKGS